MFSVKQKRYIAKKVQEVLKSEANEVIRNARIREVLISINHPDMPDYGAKFNLKIEGMQNGIYKFLLHVDGAESWSWADIRDNGSVVNPIPNPFNEMIAEKNPPELPGE